MKKNFFPTYSVLEKSAYQLTVAISVEIPRYIYTAGVLSTYFCNFFPSTEQIPLQP